MDRKAIAIHIVICLAVGGVISLFTPVKLLGAAFWVSAGLFINGSIACVEDGLPGGFENPDGLETPDCAKGLGATMFALKSLAITIVLATIGTLIHLYT